MKNLKRIFAMFACVAIVLVSSLNLTACSKEEIAENTETIIDTTTSILPVEYSKSLAEGILANACATSISAKSIKSDYLMESYSFAGFKADQDIYASAVYLDVNGKITERMDIGYLGQVAYTAYAISVKQANDSYKYYSLVHLGTDKIYSEITGNSYGSLTAQNNTSKASVYGGKMNLTGLIITSQDDGQIASVESMLDHVIGGRYFNGKTYINASYDYAGAWGSQFSEKKSFDVEYVIEEGRITSIRILSKVETYGKGEDGISNTEDDVKNGTWNVVETFKYDYSGHVINDAPTSINGYVLNSNAVCDSLR